MKEPLVAVPPPPVEVQEVLLVEAQFSVDVLPLTTEDGAAESETEGFETLVIEVPPLTVVELPPPPHEVRPENTNIIAKRTRS